MSDMKRGCAIFTKLINVLQRFKLVELWWKHDEREQYVKRRIDFQKR